MKYALTASITFIVALLIIIGYLLACMTHVSVKCEAYTNFNAQEISSQINNSTLTPPQDPDEKKSTPPQDPDEKKSTDSTLPKKKPKLLPPSAPSGIPVDSK